MGKMLDDRLALHQKLVDILGTSEVYFQPPSTIKMKYPAIVYSREKIDKSYAGNMVYKQDYAYQIIVMDRDPDSEITDQISKLPMCNYSNSYEADGLNHDVFILYK